VSDALADVFRGMGWTHRRRRQWAPSARARWLTSLAVIFILGGCGTGLLPGDPALPPGSREWIISVDNQSAQPARLMVAEDTAPVGDLVGTANPAQVPPGTKQDVVFKVPPGQTWAIFVNPSPQLGPLILARDVPANVQGRLPLSIFVGPNGDPSVGVDADAGPGWFGN
jgi:hypothetical protein